MTMSDRLWWWRYEWRQFCREGLWRGIANRLPMRVIYFAFFRAWAAGMDGGKHPDETTFSEVAQRLEKGTTP